LLNEIDLDGVIPHDVLFDLLAQVANHNRGFIEATPDQSIQNVTDNRLATNIQEYFWNRVCMGT
jgi:hypothetical protein